MSETAATTLPLLPTVLDVFRRASDRSMTVNQALILLHLAHTGPAACTDLSERLSVSTASITGILDVLETRDLITRVRTAPDRRIVTARITPAGLSAVHILCATPAAA